MPIFSVNGVNLNYEVIGQGPVVVFLHGMTGSTQDWINQAAVLSPNYQVVALDMRGHGKSDAPKTEAEYSITIFSQDVLALLELLGIKKCCLGGHSIGGIIALQFALSHSDRLAGLVLVDTSSGQFDEDPKSCRLTQKLFEMASSQGLDAAFEHDAHYNPMKIEIFKKHPNLRELSRKKMLTTSVPGYIYGTRAIAKWQSITPRLSEIRVPTLIYWGDEDAPSAEAAITLEKGIAGSELVTVRGVGHNPHEEAPEVFNQALFKFLERVEW
jgi:2-succinyl-6-hydroxy-2,4-cyclohexadiene-1-carboxylate synthase